MSKRTGAGKRVQPAVQHRPRVQALLLLAGLGSLLSLWLLWIHVRLQADPAAGSACNFGGALNCDVVNASRYASVFGVPVAYLGLALYLVLGALALVELRGGAARSLAYARGLGAVAVAFSAYLAFVSAVVIGAFCLFCVGLYGINAAVAALGWWRPPAPRPRFFDRADRDLKTLLGSPRGRPALAGVLLLLAGAVGVAVAEAALSPDPAPAEVVGVGGREVTALPGQAFGPEDAPLTVVEFSDFECPYCRRAARSLEALRETFARRVRFVFKHFPLDPRCNPTISGGGHDRACAAAEAAACAGEQGRFWGFHDEVFDRGAGEAQLQAAAEAAGLDLDAWRRCRHGEGVRDRVAADVADGTRLGVRGTPFFLIGDRVIRGAQSTEQLEAEIRAALTPAGRRGGAGTPPDRSLRGRSAP